jgi:competence protein ComEC
MPLAAILAVLGIALFKCAVNPAWLLIGYPSLVLFARVFRLSRLARIVLALASIPVVAFFYALWRAPHAASHDLASYAGRQVIFKARVCEQVCPASEYAQRFVVAPYQLLFPDIKPLIGNAQLEIKRRSLETMASLKAGAVIKVTASIALPSESHSPWQTSVSSYLAKNSIFCCAITCPNQVQLLAADSCETSLGNRLDGLILKLRERIVNAHNSNLGSKSGGLLTSMVLGERAVAVDSSVVSDFRTVGLSHLIAASGFNLTIVTAMSFWLARVFFRSRRLACMLAFLSMIIFVGLAGLSASVMRAAIMCALFVTATYFYRSLHGLAALAFAFLLTMIMQPDAVADPGCQLSYAATLGIICGATPLTRLLLSGPGPRWVRSLVESACVVLSAQTAVMPIQIYYFWRIGLLFLPANLIVALVVAPVTILGFASSLAIALTVFVDNPLLVGACWLLDALAAYPLQGIIYVAHYFSSFPQAAITLGPAHLLSVCLYYVAFVSVLLSLHIKRRRIISLIVLLLFSIPLFWRPEAPQLTIAVFPQSIVLFGTQKQAFIFGERTRQVDKFLTYSGVGCNGKIDRSPWKELEQCRICSSQATYVVSKVSQSKTSDSSRQDPRASKLPCRLPGSLLADWGSANLLGTDTAGRDTAGSDQETSDQAFGQNQVPLAASSVAETIRAGKPIIHLSIVERCGRSAGKEAPPAITSTINTAGGANWLIVVRNDPGGRWIEEKTKLASSRRCADADEDQLLGEASLPEVKLIACPHRKIVIIPASPRYKRL